MRKTSIIIGFLFLTLVFSGIVQASSDILGMGNAPGPAAPGDNGIEWNPAAVNAGNKFFLDTSLLNTTLWTDSLSVYDILNYGGLVEGSDSNWDEQDVEQILGAIPADGFSLYLDHVSRQKLVIGPVGFSFGLEGHVRGTVSKDIFNLLLKGTADYVDLSDGTESQLVKISDTETDILATTDAAFTLSIPFMSIKAISDNFDECYIGGTFHQVWGGYANFSLTGESDFYIGYGEEDSDGFQIITIRFEDDELMQDKLDQLEDGEMYPLVRAIYTFDKDNLMDTSYLATGSAVDLGIYLRKDKLSYGVSLMNLGSLNISNYQIMEYGLIKDDEQELGVNFVSDPIIREGNKPLSVPLPTRFNVGVAYQPSRWLLLGAQVSQVTNVSVNLDENDNIISKTRSTFEMGAGLEFNPLYILPLRVGIISAENNLTYTGGLGLHLGPIKADLGGAISGKSASISLNTSLEF